MRLWQRRTHPWLWFLAIVAIVAALTLFLADHPSFLSSR